MAPLQSRPYMLCAEQGRFLRSLGAMIYVKATAEQTDCRFNLFEVTCPPGFATPLHIHYAEDVAVFVLDGALVLFWGCEEKQAAVGSFFFQPRGTPHGLRTKGPLPARILYMTMPAGFDRFVIEHQAPRLDSETERSAAGYNIEVLGPLPE